MKRRQELPMYVDPENIPIMNLPEEHPSRRYVSLRLEFLRKYDCIEIPWEGKEHLAYDFEWYSIEDDKTWKMSDFMYTYIWTYCAQTAWIENPPEPTETELIQLRDHLEALVLIEEWLAAAADEPRAKRIAIDAQGVMQAGEISVRRRLDQIGVDADDYLSKMT